MARTEDSHLAKQQEMARQPATAPGGDEDRLPEAYPPVATRAIPPAQGIARVAVLSAANPVLQVLTQDPRRQQAILLAIDNDVYLATSPELAQAVAGGAAGTDAAYLPAGIAVPWPSRAPLWAACTTTATSTRVTILIGKDDQ